MFHPLINSRRKISTGKNGKIKDILENKGWKINIPYAYQMIIDGELSFEVFLKIKEKSGDIAIRQSQKVDIIKRYWDFIKNSDVILVLNINKKGIEGYIDGNT
jgi:hypothetical protein